MGKFKPAEGNTTTDKFMSVQQKNRLALRHEIKGLDLKHENADVLLNEYSVERICECLLHGITPKEVAEEVGISIYFMMRWLRLDPTRHAKFKSAMRDYAFLLRSDTIMDVEEVPKDSVEASHQKTKTNVKLKVAEALDPVTQEGSKGTSVSINLGFNTPVPEISGEVIEHEKAPQE